MAGLPIDGAHPLCPPARLRRHNTITGFAQAVLVFWAFAVTDVDVDGDVNVQGC